VIPVADPNASTMSQRVIQYQAVMQLAKDAPQLYDLPMLHRQMIEVLGVKNAAKLVPTIEDMKPVDPVTENMDILRGKPVKAFLIQDHEAHLAVHMAAMRDPKLAQIMGQNPQAQAMQAAAAAHIMEHVAFQYRKEIERMLGAALPPMKDDAKDGEDVKSLPPEMEAQLAQLVAQAAAKLLQKNTAEAQQQQAQQQAQDPLIQMQQQELQIKQSEVQRKAKKDADDLAAKQAEVQRKARKDAADAAAKADDIRLKEMEIRNRQQVEGTRMGIDIAKSHAQSGHQSNQRAIDFQKHREQLVHQQTQQPKEEPKV
jgi:hypothetical protein